MNMNIAGTTSSNSISSGTIINNMDMGTSITKNFDDRATCTISTSTDSYEAILSKLKKELGIEEKNTEKKPKFKPRSEFRIKRVTFNDPATIIFWEDGTKTVVKAHNEPFDPEKGLAMAICKKVFSNQSNFNNVFKKYLPKEEN